MNVGAAGQAEAFLWSVRPPTVLQVVPGLAEGGAEGAAVAIARGIVEAGGRSIVVSHGGPLVPSLVRAGARHVTLPVHSKNPALMAANARTLARLVREEGVDILHARSRAPAWSVRWAARRTGVPFVTTHHGKSGWNGAGVLRRLYGGVMAAGDTVIAVSDFTASIVEDLYGIGAPRLVTIPRGIDMDYFDAGAVSAERIVALARRWALTDGAPVILLPGRIVRWKGQGVAIEAFARLRARRPEWEEAHLVLVGREDRRSRFARALDREIAARGLEGAVRRPGPVSDMPAAYMLADVVIAPSIEPEPFGRVAVEAQAMARPVIVSDHGGPRETIRDGETGWRVRPGDAAALANVLDEALSLAPDERQALGARARGHVITRFGLAAMIRATLTVYDSLMAGG